MANIVVLGAGVSGLTCALQLARSNVKKSKITIVAKHMPGDYDIEYASPWAGANYTPDLADKQSVKQGDSTNTVASDFERDTWPELERLARDVPEAGIHFQEEISLRRAKDTGTPAAAWYDPMLNEDAGFRKIMPNCRNLTQSELPPGHDAGVSFTSVCINTALYLPWLASQCLKHGVVIRRGVVSHIADAAKLHHSGKRADLIVNCTGLSSLRLGGVEDGALYPGRGQIVVVRNESPAMFSVSGTDDGSEEVIYIMTRAAGGGTVLGGCVQPGNWESQPDMNLANRIMKRCVDVCPKMVAEGKGIEGLSVIRHSVGLRPMRKGSIRVEREIIKGVPVVHNYGHGGYGYQTSYAAAEAVRKLVEASLQESAKL